MACHSVDGSKLVGPTFKNLFGSVSTVIAGNREINRTVDDEYITTSVYNPDAEIVKGFAKGLMKSYTGVLKETDLKIIKDYLKTLGETK
jgi:cytochrome c oxidase subunit 2